MTRAFQIALRRTAAALLIAGAAFGAGAQLNEKCTVSVLNRNAQASPDGSWIVPTIPANFGPVRARATCVENGVTTSGESDLFTIAPNSSVDVPPIQLGQSTPIPSILTLTSPLTTLSAEGAQTQITVVASYADASMRNVTTATGTTYTISNPAIATITPSGVVTAVASGTAVVNASHEGTSGLLAINVVLSADSDGDGILDDIELREGLDPNNPTDALEDFDRDGLSNADEVRAGTLLRNRDTDGDTLADGEEAQAGSDGFITSPLLPDTDGDGIRDALEVQTGSNPTLASSYNLAGALSSIEVTPPVFTLITNVIQPEAYTQLNVVGHLRDGYTINLTSTARGTNYASSDLNICNFGSPDGRVYAGTAGACTVTVLNNGFTASVAGAVRSFTPVALSQISIPGYANNVDVADDYAYVAAGSAGLVVVDVSNPNAPAIVGSVDTNGNANDVRVLGRYAYVADGGAGLKIIDVLNPAAPVIVGAVDTPGDAVDVMVAGNLAYIADSYSGLTILNVASPSAPILVSTIDTPGVARGVDVAGTLALIVDDSPSSVRVFDVANASQPRLLGSVAISGYGKDIRVNGTIAVTASYTGGMQVVDFSNPAAPRVVGGLPGSDPTGFVPRDVELAGQFAIFAEQLFPNAVPMVSVNIPTAPVMRGIINFSPLGDYAGTGIAVSGAYLYMTGEYYIVGPDNGSTGNTRLFIGQYLPLEDLAGVAPTVTITSPSTNEPQYEGTSVTAVAEATDDVAVALVTFEVNGQVVFTDSSAPYEYTFDVPAGVSNVNLTVRAVDLAGNVGSDTVTFQVVPDPLTTVSGIVVDEDGAPLVGASVTTLGDHHGTTGTGGAFSIYGVPTVRGPLVANATATRADGTPLSGSSAPFEPVRNGVTNVGTITAVSATFETNYGTLISRCDDCYYQYTLPFAFPFYGNQQTTAFVGTNGYITFGGGDWTYTETLPSFSNMPRISAFFDDLYGRSTGAVWVNNTLPGRFVVTYDKVQHYSWGGSNTIQLTLFDDGRILFAYRGITAINTGSITGITPGPNAAFEQVDYSQRTNFDVAANTSIYEYFTSTNLFDLDYSYVLFTPRGAGYNVRTILPPPAPSLMSITGSPEDSAASVNGVRVSSNASTTEGGAFAKAEVEILSSGDPSWRGMTNTDNRGNFKLDGVPAGGITIQVTKKGKVIGQGGAVIRGKSDPKHIKVQHPRPEKNEPDSH